MEFAQFVFPHDPQMSSRHFALECSPLGCVVRDLKSSNGTFVNNQRIDIATLRDGDEILAGQTLFRVRVDATASAPPRPVLSATQFDDGLFASTASLMPAAANGRLPSQLLDITPRKLPGPAAPVRPVLPASSDVPLGDDPPPAAARPGVRPPSVVRPVMKEPVEWPVDLRNFRPDPGNFAFAIIDTAAGTDLLFHAQQLNMAPRCLFPEPTPDAIAAVAPYVVEVHPKSNFMHPWTDNLGKNAGILLESPESLGTIVEHWTKIFLSRTEDGPSCFFRFYDPRVLRGYLATCSLKELTRFFGPTHAVYVEDETPAKLLRFMPTNAGLRIQVLQVQSSAASPLPTQFAF